MTMSMTLKQFEALRLVLANGTYKYAAEKLNVTQSAISRLIGQLEQETGFALFDRNDGRLRVTPEGRRLYSAIETILIGVDQINAIAEDERAYDSASLRVGTIPSLGFSVLPPAVRVMRKRFRNLRVTIDVATRSALEYATENGDFDVALVNLPTENRTLFVEPLSTVSSVCVLPKKHALAEGPFVSPQDLEGDQYISMNPGSWIRYRTDELFASLGTKRVLQIETGSMHLICSLVSAGLGVSLVHHFVAQKFANSLVVKPFRPRFDFDFGLIMPSGAKRTLVTGHFISCIRDMFKGFEDGLGNGHPGSEMLKP